MNRSLREGYIYVHNMAKLTGVAVLLVTAGCMPRGIKVSEFGNLRLYGSGTLKIASIASLPWPANLSVRLSDGTVINEDSIALDEVVKRFGEPDVDFVSGDGRHVVTFKRAECSVTFRNKVFESIDFYDGAQLINAANGKSVTLPASEAKVHEVFGRPTEIKYLEKPS